jgi:hypothetical protein
VPRKPNNKKTTQTFHPHYSSWRWWRQACLNQNCPDYANHGGRGITIEFDSFEDFAEYVDAMGTCPAGYRLVRIDQNDHFRAGNLMFALPVYIFRHNMRNISATIGPETRNIGEWAEIYGLKMHTIYNRIYNGMTPEEAITRPVRSQKKRITANA